MAALEIDQCPAAYNLVPPVELFTLPGQGSNNRTVGVRTGVGNFILKTYLLQSDPEAIRYEHRLLAWLARANLSFAVPAPIQLPGGNTLCRTPEGWQTLSVELPGHVLNVSRSDHVMAMGAALGELHLALAGCSPEPRPGLPPFGDLILNHLRTPDADSLTPERLEWPTTAVAYDLLEWWQNELSQVGAFAHQTYRSLPRQVIHRDFDPGTTLVSAGRITGVLDFEFAGLDVHALDMADSLKLTMRVWENAQPWEAARSFCRGYCRVNTLTAAEAVVLPWLTRLRDAASMALRFSRCLAAGNTAPLFERLQNMENSAQWLQQHGQRLVDIVGEGCE